MHAGTPSRDTVAVLLGTRWMEKRAAGGKGEPQHGTLAHLVGMQWMVLFGMRWVERETAGGKGGGQCEGTPSLRHRSVQALNRVAPLPISPQRNRRQLDNLYTMLQLWCTLTKCTRYRF